ncbi:hypothetical protein ACQKP1_15770 [Allorhizobium sp. NPDC080224]|uniref:hypothetical protein n=1 Tax=Allorhizobium sp. NPDC080224 TaxID=3390547 RepID=UPI003D02D11C
MTRKSIVSQADLRRFAAIAKSEGVQIEVVKDGVSIRIIPEADQAEPVERPTQSKSSYFDGATALPVLTGKTGYAIPDDPNHPLQKWYDSLGFDPHTMGDADMKRLSEKAHREWIASIPGTKIGKRELACLEQLCFIGVGTTVAAHSVKGLGSETQDKLEARGFIETEETLPRAEVELGRSLKHVRLLKAGADALEGLSERGNEPAGRQRNLKPRQSRRTGAQDDGELPDDFAF